MSDDTQNEAEFVAESNASDELSVLKQRARLMGIVFSNNIGVQALRQKIEAKQSEGDEVSDQTSVLNPLVGETKYTDVKARPKTLREALLESEMKLVRLRITNMDPKKKELPGEIFTIANEYLGTVTKYVPFGEVTDDGYHVPHCIYTMLKDRNYLNIRVTKKANGQSKVESKWAKEFALEILPPLTKNELTNLATAQAAAGVFNDTNDMF